MWDVVHTVKSSNVQPSAATCTMTLMQDNFVTTVANKCILHTFLIIIRCACDGGHLKKEVSFKKNFLYLNFLLFLRGMVSLTAW